MPTQKQRKLAVMGSRGVGKSTTVLQFVENHFVDGYNPTIENTFHKLIKYKGDEYNTEILDTAGQDEYSIFHTQYSIGIHGYLLVYSVTSKSSFELIKILNDKILNACGTEKVPRVLLGNKCDLDVERQISTQEGQATAAEWGCGFVECSAKLNSNIEDAFTRLVAEVEKAASPDPLEGDKKCCLL
eukprot:TRINITY_DN1672_c0_g1_i1.p1 TRINITY_DN1672_c0_g1~~TRINITY_DN1672_c0_g1_i1.p1  ORF type:complete len:202 (+),score=24.54 TRINITY_DN1672_c0_g1_i1:49-606(+)